MAQAIDIVEIQGRTYPAIGGITGAAFTTALARITVTESDIAGHETRLDAYDALDVSDRLDSLEGYSVLFRADAQPDPDSASTASTTVYSTIASTTVTIPVGLDDNWTIKAVFTVEGKHSAAGASDFRVVIAGNNGTAKTPTLASATFRRVALDHTVSGVDSGVKTITLEGKSNTAGTTTFDNPTFVIYALP